MNHCDLLMTASYIVTQNERRDVLREGAVAIRAGRIEAMGPAVDVEARCTAAARRDLGNALIMPGLVNAHTHAPMTLLRGLADDLPLMEWLTQHIFPLEAKLTPRMLEVGTMLACAEMLRTGSTACADMYLHESYIYKAMDTCGIRAVVGEGIFDVPSLDHADAARAFAAVREQAEDLRNHPRLRYAVMPHSVYTTSRKILKMSAALAGELDLPLHIHLAETPSEIARCLELYGCRPVELCRETGILGPRTLVAHGVELDDGEMDTLAESGVCVAHCPRSNMKLASGIAPVPRLLRKNVGVCLGTDGASSNNGLNMFAEMSAAALLHKVHSLDPTALPAQTVLDMATVNGGKALGWPELGRLAAGGPADLTVLDLHAPNMVPLTSPVSQLVYAATGHEVLLTMVDGNILYDNGNFPAMDYAALVAEAQEIRQWLVTQA